MGMAGSGLSDKNVRLRFLMYIFMGVIALGSVMYWKVKLFENSEYVELTFSSQKEKDPSFLQSDNYQIETFETSPSVK